MSEHNKVSIELKEYFKKKEITQKEIAERVGSTQQIVGKLLNGRPFGKKTAATWSKEFDLNPSWLITGNGAMFLNEEEEMNTTKKVVEMGSQIFAQQILQMINDGELYPASVVREKNEELQRKEQEIQRLNRELGALAAEVDRLTNELKSEDAQTKSA